MNLKELTQPVLPGQKPKSLKIRNVTKVIVTNMGNGVQVQLHGAGEQTYVAKVTPGNMLQLHLIEPKVVHIAEK
jgi:hypothetical protein